MTILLNPQFTASLAGTSPPKTTRQRPWRAAKRTGFSARGESRTNVRKRT